MLLMIDNYDSFTYNLVQYFGELDQDVQVYRNDKITIGHIKKLCPSHIVISPGPCTPNEAGISIEVIDNFKKEVPILGVCLGHQSIGQAFGGKIVHAKNIMHGKTSNIYHARTDVFKDFENPFTATRYHSLVIEEKTIPSCLEVIAQTKSDDQSDNEIMAIKHKDFHTYGVQFHPESIMSEHGHQILKNFLEIK